MARWRRTAEESLDWLGVLLFGSVWGLAEATLGGALHAAGVFYCRSVAAAVSASGVF